MSEAATPGAAMVTIAFTPHDKTTRVPAGMTIFNAANWAGLAIDSTCGAKGTCGKCKVQILSGYDHISAADRKVFSEAELADGWRLSCRAAAERDIVCRVPRLMGNPKAALMGYGRHVILSPNVHKVYLEPARPTLADQRSDAVRLTDALSEAGFEPTFGLGILRRLPQTLRAAGWAVTAVIVGDTLVAVEPGDTRTQSYGLAFDIGTTTVVGTLIDLHRGVPLGVRSVLNGQAAFGADVIARISHAMTGPAALDELTGRIIASLNDVTDRLLTEAAIDPQHVYETVLAGNATMLHLALGIDPQAIGVEPFIPAIDGALDVTAAELGLMTQPLGKVHCLPHLGAYVGADLVAGLLATGLARGEGVRLLVDVGTNGEIILGSRERTLATAAPAGPAFEGAQIVHGMRASDGAIEGVTIDSRGVALQVIGDTRPIGLCGSGLLDAVAQLRLSGLITPSGRFITGAEAAERLGPDLAARLITDEAGMRSFVLAWPDESGHGQAVTLTQRDIRELQFAKGSIAGGIAVLMAELGVTTDDLVDIYLAGSFGSYINPQSARIIGLVPPVPVARISAVGNAAGEGAKMALLSFRERQSAWALVAMVEYLELSGRGEFNDAFMAVLPFPELDTLGLTPTVPQVETA
jgi:uncharacterized 2Fe-2S/4Fe-4S cluster protein (DUF4445 family)